MNPDLTAADLRKPPRGEHRRERRERETAVVTQRNANKAKAKARDLQFAHGCRFLLCDCRKSRYKPKLEVAHLDDISTGGSDETENLVLLCDERHRGAPSLHSKDFRIDKLSPLGADGCLAFYLRNPETGELEHVYSERSVGISETRGA